MKLGFLLRDFPGLQQPYCVRDDIHRVLADITNVIVELGESSNKVTFETRINPGVQ